MKKQLMTLTKIGLTIAMGTVIAVGSAHGQSLAYPIRANIPFDFTVGEEKLPAGEYSIGRARQDSGDTVLAISSVDRPGNAFPITSAVQTLEPKGTGTLVFHRYGDEYFLFQVWAAGANTGRVIPKSRGEREMERMARLSAAKVGKKAKAVETVPIVVGQQ
jgi:hypothetical protein